MAYSKNSNTENNRLSDTEKVSDTGNKVYSVKKKIPLDEQVMVRNMTGGKLVYNSKRLVGYSEEWHEFGEEIPMEMAELYAMKNTDRRFFTENWIEVDISVLRDLQMDRFYKDAITIDEINNLFKMDIDTLVRKIEKMSPNTKNCIGIKAMEMIADGRLNNINTISALEKALNYELYER